MDFGIHLRINLCKLDYNDCYLTHTYLPGYIYPYFERPYGIRVVGHNKEFDEWDESVCYLEVWQYNSQQDPFIIYAKIDSQH